MIFIRTSDYYESLNHSHNQFFQKHCSETNRTNVFESFTKSFTQIFLKKYLLNYLPTVHGTYSKYFWIHSIHKTDEPNGLLLNFQWKSEVHIQWPLYFPMRPRERIFECQWSDATHTGKSHDNDNMHVICLYGIHTI